MTTLNQDKNRRVLVIDDNRSIHDDFRKILSPATATSAALEAEEAAAFGCPADTVEHTQFELDSAYQGQEGVLLVKKELEAGRPYAMAFVDVRMPPGWDGIETTQRIWAIDPELQIVICTAYSDYSWGEMFEKLGRRDGLLILKKPFDAVEALQLAHALTEKWWLHEQFRRKMGSLENRVTDSTCELKQANLALQTEVVKHRQAAEGLQLKTAFLEAQVNSSIDGILVVDQNRNTALQNQRFVDLFKMPQHIADEGADENRLKWAMDMVKNSQQFVQKVDYLYAHPKEISRDEVELKDGTTLDRYSSPALGNDGKYYGRIWTYRDVTARKQSEDSLRESEEKFRQLAESITDVFWMTSPDLSKVYYVSPAYERIWNRSVESLYADPHQWAEAILPEERERVFAAFSSLGADKGSVSVEFQISRPDGTVRWIFSRGFQVRNAAGKLIRLTGIASDITERKRTEMAFMRLVAIVESSDDAIIGKDLDGIITTWNKGAEKIFGYPACEITGTSIKRLIPTDRLDEENHIIEKIRRGESGEHFETLRQAKDGRLINVSMTASAIKDATGKVIGASTVARDITARKQTETALRESNEKFHQLADNITDAFWIRSPDMSEVQYVSPAFERIWGRSVGSLYANPHQWADFILPEDRDRVLGAFAALAGETRSLDIEYRIVRPEGEIRWIRARGFQVRDSSNKLIRHIGIITDITERKQFDAHIFQSQKLETVGKLAGGIAHEFNSILTAIIGHSDLLTRDLPMGSPLAKNAAEINQAATRAAKLTRQLLAYGRKQILQPEILDLNRIIASMESMFRQIMGDAVDLHIVTAPSLHAVKADAGQIEQVIMNMAVNAREAMPNGGKVTFETADVSFAQESVGRVPELKPGDYVMLAITDTGAGMTEQVKARTFEPFFTTKAVGQGTGLGLSTCHGIVKQSGGHVSVYSELGRGTTFKIYLPQVEQQAQISILRPDSQDLPRGTETILLVEDDPALLKLAVILLRRLGYTVLAAANGIEALSLKQQRTVGHIDLLFTDVVMPHMGGKELADRIRASFPHTRILFTSSYTENAIVHQGVLDEGVALLQKPFTPSALARKLREVLDQPAAPIPDTAQQTFALTQTSGAIAERAS